MRDRGLTAAIVLALALRAWPLHVAYINPDQGNVPQLAVVGLLADDWRPPRLEYPSGMLYLFRASYRVAYAIGHATGAFGSRLDLLGTWLENPFPFLLVGRVFACLCGVATVALAARLAVQLGGPRCAALAALLLAVGFLHVRDSHYGMGDVPGAAFFTATLVAAERYRSRGGARRLLGAAALAGLAAGFRYPHAVAALAVPVALLLRPDGRTLRGLGLLLLAAVVAIGAFAVLSPYTLLEPGRAWRDFQGELIWAYHWTGIGPVPLSFGTVLTVGAGTVACELALVGLVALAAARAPGLLVVLVPAVALTVPLLRAGRLFARYTLPLMPLIAVLAACGIDRVARLAPRRLAPVLRVLLVLLAVADPAARSLAAVDLLSREDTRQQAGRWLQAHLAPGDTVFLSLPRAYANPVLPPPPQLLFETFGYEIARDLARRPHTSLRQRYHVLYYDRAPDLEATLRGGGWVVTFDHTLLPKWGTSPRALLAIVRARGLPVARFVGLPPGASALYEPVDANFLPMRGLLSVARPGPNITVWRLPPAPGVAAPPAPASPR